MALITLRLFAQKGAVPRNPFFEYFIQVTGDCLSWGTMQVRELMTVLRTASLDENIDFEEIEALAPAEFAERWLFDSERRELLSLDSVLRHHRGASALLRRLMADSIQHLEEALHGVHMQADPYSSLRFLAELLELGEEESAAVSLGLLRAESQQFCDLLQCQNAGSRKEAVARLAQAMGFEPSAFAKAMSPQSRLYEYGIFDKENRVTDLMDVFKLSDEFAQLLLTPHSSLDSLVKSFLKSLPLPALDVHDYPHMRRELEEASCLLRGAMGARERGIHLILYGLPGTGKTEFARLLGAAIGADTYEIGFQDGDGSSASRNERYGFLRIAQQFLSRSRNSLLVFDEAEDVFPVASGHDFFSMFGSRRPTRHDVSKAWVNRFLEDSPVPMIWISNNVDQIDPANLRRFTYHLEFRAPPRAVRGKIAARYLGVRSREVVTLFCPRRRKNCYGKHASWQRPHNAANSIRAPKVARKDECPSSALRAESYHGHEVAIPHHNHRCAHGPDEAQKHSAFSCRGGCDRGVPKKNTPAAGRHDGLSS